MDQLAILPTQPKLLPDSKSINKPLMRDPWTFHRALFSKQLWHQLWHTIWLRRMPPLKEKMSRPTHRVDQVYLSRVSSNSSLILLFKRLEGHVWSSPCDNAFTAGLPFFKPTPIVATHRLHHVHCTPCYRCSPIIHDARSLCLEVNTLGKKMP